MKNLFQLLAIFVLSLQALAQDPNQHKKNCDEKSDAMACARYAYSLKRTNAPLAIEYNTKACKLGNETACFNLNESKSAGIQGNMEKIVKQQENLNGCYRKHSDDTETRDWFKEKNEDTKTIKSVFTISKEGILKNITISGNRINSKMENCIIDLFANQTFKGSDGIQTLEIFLTVAKNYKPTPVPKSDSGLEGLKDVDGFRR